MAHLKNKPAAMSEIISSVQQAGKYKRHKLKIDMTPMVDLGFLLITFFIFTSSISESKALKLTMPATGPPIKISELKSLTVLLAKDNVIYYYFGKFVPGRQLAHTNYHPGNGLGKIIRAKQKELGNARNELMILIKPTENSTYNNVVNLLDEIQINAVKKYAIVALLYQEKALLNR
jgi:biopolymer transport protein ExbD